MVSASRHHNISMMLQFSAIFGTTGAIAQTIVPSDTVWERLGVAGLLIAGAFFMLRYFMSVVEKKDDQLKSNSDALIEHIRRGYETQAQTNTALHQLGETIRANTMVLQQHLARDQRDRGIP